MHGNQNLVNTRNRIKKNVRLREKDKIKGTKTITKLNKSMVKSHEPMATKNHLRL